MMRMNVRDTVKTPQGWVMRMLAIETPKGRVLGQGGEL